MFIKHLRSQLQAGPCRGRWEAGRAGLGPDCPQAGGLPWKPLLAAASHLSGGDRIPGEVEKVRTVPGNKNNGDEAEDG